jgi:sulfur relay (sulfurtransferase) complex TusBCD TusD component (DsrE family)
VKRFTSMLVALVVLTAGAASAALAGDKDPLFINMTTDESHRASMAINFGKSQMERGHPLTIFLNDKGVQVASKGNANKYGAQQKMLSEVMQKGATVIACPMCMKHYGVKETDLVSGIKVGKPELTGGRLFQDNTRTLTW